MNKIFLIGRITKDLELRTTKSGNSVCEFTLAVNRDKENTDFITCQVWNKQAENLCKYQGKGSLISVAGELRVETYEINDKKHYKTYVLSNAIEYLSPIEKIQEKPKETSKNPFEEFGQQIEIEDSDLPF